MQKPFNRFFAAPVWGRGFRPFFFLGALFSTLSIGMWGAFYAGFNVLPPAFFLDPIAWHAHEMIYGFCMAVVSGFLLTAVANWTGGAPARQMHLAGLCLLWCVGRIVMAFDLGLPAWFIIALETAYVPALAVSLAIPLIRSWNKRNFIFLALLTALFACDIRFFMTRSLSPLYGSLFIILMMISLIGGRIIPAFTVGALRMRGLKIFQTDQAKTDTAALVSLACTGVCLVFWPQTVALGCLAALACVLHAARMRHYHTLKALCDPLLWILHVGYAWLVLGLGLLALTGFGVLETRDVVHAFTAGCIGSMILGMICRVALGHTGHMLEVGKVTLASFFALQLAAVLRVFGPIFMPAYMAQWVGVSALLWTLCFACYLAVFSKILFSARPDGLPA